MAKCHPIITPERKSHADHSTIVVAAWKTPGFIVNFFAALRVVAAHNGLPEQRTLGQGRNGETGTRRNGETGEMGTFLPHTLVGLGWRGGKNPHFIPPCPPISLPLVLFHRLISQSLVSWWSTAMARLWMDHFLVAFYIWSASKWVPFRPVTVECPMYVVET